MRLTGANAQPTLTNSNDIAGLVSGSPALTPGFANGAANNQTSAIVAARPTFNWLSPGSLYIGTGANVRFGIDRATGQTRNSSCAWGVLSDARLKNSLRDIACPLDTCLWFRGHWFEYIDPKSVMADEGERMGFVSQEVRAAVPQWVREGEDGILSVVPTASRRSRWKPCGSSTKRTRWSTKTRRGASPRWRRRTPIFETKWRNCGRWCANSPPRGRAEDRSIDRQAVARGGLD